MFLLYLLHQYLIYDLNDFFADVGGYLGLLLGSSFFGIYEIATSWSYRIGKLLHDRVIKNQQYPVII